MASVTILLMFKMIIYIINGNAPPPKMQLTVERNVDDNIYTMIVDVGNKPMNVVIDTGSTLLWIANESLSKSQLYKPEGYDGEICNKCDPQHTIPKYGYNLSIETLTYHNWQNLCNFGDGPSCVPTSSPTPPIDYNYYIQSKPNCSCNPLYIINYAVGNITGYRVNDEIAIGAHKASSYPFGVAMSDSTYISGFASGVIGLGISDNAAIPGALDVLFPNKSDIFSLYFGKCPVLLLDYPQQYAKRYYYEQYYVEVPISTKFAYTFSSYRIGFYNSSEWNQTVLIDSGTSFIIAPSDFNLDSAIKKSFKCKENYKDCVFKSNLWNGTYELDPEKIDIDNLPTISIYYGRNGNERFDIEWCYYIFTERDLSDTKHYLIGITQIPNINIWVLGDLFIRKYFVTFNKKHHKLGIAPSKGRTPITHPNAFCMENYGKGCGKSKCRQYPQEDDYIVDEHNNPCKQ